MSWFFDIFSGAHPYAASAIKFLFLGTLGEYLGAAIRQRRLYPFSIAKLFLKALIWAFLGVVVKWAFSSFVILVLSQATAGLIPIEASIKGSLAFAFFVSLEMNLFFAPFLISLHRLLDNIVDRKWNWSGIEIGIYSIVWFWIPAHTITFLLPEAYQILFAAFLSLALGVILGLSFKSRSKSSAV